MKSVALIAVLLCLGTALAQSTWAIVDPDFATISMANSFYADNTGYVAGGTASGGPLLLYTDDGGVTFTNENLIGNNHAAFLSINMYDANNGIAGALGFFGLFACGAYTHDGQNWNSTHDDLLCAIQDCQAIDENNMVMVGVWSDRQDFQGNGIQLSTDGGSSWTGYNWVTFNDIEARYAWFESADYGYVAGGLFPSFKSEHVRHFNQHVHFNKETQRWHMTERKQRLIDGYAAVLALVTDGGSTWTTLVNISSEGIYFNEISCTDQNNCWLAAEGIDKSGNDVAYIYHTNDGWQTNDIQLTVPGGSLVTIAMLNTSFGWAGGALLQSGVNGTLAGFEGQFWLTTDGGSTWTLNDELKNFYAFYLSTTSEEYAYASGITPIGLSSFASYSPSN